MPVYAYTCPACGGFDLWRDASAAGAPAACPACGSDASRRFTPPGVTRTGAPLRRTLEAEERSAHEPAVVGRPSSGRPLPGHTHGGHPPWVLGH